MTSILYVLMQILEEIVCSFHNRGNQLLIRFVDIKQGAGDRLASRGTIEGRKENASTSAPINCMHA